MEEWSGPGQNESVIQYENGKRLIGRTDMEDAVKKLDRLTQEEARMATTEVLRATHTINEGVRVVRNLLMVPSGTRRLKVTTQEVSVNKD
jgi:hypothetical protein